MFELLQIKRGKTTQIMVDERPKVVARMKQLKASQRGANVRYLVLPTDDTEKFKQKPVGGHPHQ